MPNFLRRFSFAAVLCSLPALAQNGELNATLFAGSDIGAKVNAAAAALSASGGTIYVPASASCYPFATPIVLPYTSVKLQGSSKYSTCLQYTGTSGTALTIQNFSSVSDLRLTGPGGTGTTGILVKGAYSKLTSDVVLQFGIGVTFGNNTYQDSFDDLNINTNHQNLYYPTGLTNSGENISFTASTISGGTSFTNCVQIGNPGTAVGAEISFINTSFDTCQIVNNEGIVKMYGGHLEDGGVATDHPFIKTFSSALDSVRGDVGTFLYGVTVQLNTTPAGSGLFEADKFAQLHIFGLQLNGMPPIPIVQLGAASGDAPMLEFVDGANPATEAQLYSIYAGAVPVLNISTPQLAQHTAVNTHSFANNVAGYGYGANQAIIARGNLLGAYQWSGSGRAWLGEQLKPTGQGTSSPGFQACGTAYFTFAGYDALGSEPTTCGSKFTVNQVTAPTVDATSGYQLNGAAIMVKGVATLASGAATVSTASACTPGPTCAYKLTNCGPNGSTGIGTPAVTSAAAGTSFVINSLGPTGSVLTTDTSKICWEIN